MSRIHHLTEIYLFVEDLLMVSASTWCIGPREIVRNYLPLSGKKPSTSRFKAHPSVVVPIWSL